MGVRIVSVYDNPTLLESFTSPVLTVPNDATVPDSELVLYYPDAHPDFATPACDPGTVIPEDEWCKGINNPSPGVLQLGATYYPPRLLKPGIWTVTIACVLNTAGELPEGFDPDTDCAVWRHLAFNIEGDITDEEAAFPWSSIDVEGACEDSDTSDTLVTDIGVPDYRGVCTCSEFFGDFAMGRGANTLSSWDVTISGVWVSDFPP